jgi:hypothetical protein
MYRALILAASLLFVTPAWAEQLNLSLPIHDVLGKRGARVLHSHGDGAQVMMTVLLDQTVYLCFQGLVTGKLVQKCMTTVDNYEIIPAD